MKKELTVEEAIAQCEKAEKQYDEAYEHWEKIDPINVEEYEKALERLRDTEMKTEEADAIYYKSLTVKLDKEIDEMAGAK